MLPKAKLSSGRKYLSRSLECESRTSSKLNQLLCTVAATLFSRHDSNAITAADAAVVNEIAVIAFGFSPQSMHTRQFAQAAVHALALLGALVEEDSRCAEQLSAEAASMMGQVTSEWVLAASKVPEWDSCLPGLPMLFEALAHCMASLVSCLSDGLRQRLLAPFTDALEVAAAQESYYESNCPALLRALEDLRARTGHCQLLHMSLACLFDEPLLVLVPSAGRAWLMTLNGVTDVQQLHCLLACQIARSLRQEGLARKQAATKNSGHGFLSSAAETTLEGQTAPHKAGLPELCDPMSQWPSRMQFDEMSGRTATTAIPLSADGGSCLQVEAVAGMFDMVQPTAWRDAECTEYLTQGAQDGAQPPSFYPANVLAPTAVPADIKAVQGIRVVTLSPMTSRWLWSCKRSFPNLAASCAMRRTLSLAEQAEWVDMCQLGEV
jgi:hypothetical protein